MKRWTVMMIPHDRGETKTFSLSAMPFWVSLSLLAVLVFSASFFFQRSRAIARDYEEHRQALASSLSAGPVPEPVALAEVHEEGLSEEEVREVEERLRREYEASLEAVTAELAELYALETKARSITGLPPRAQDTVALVEEVGDGRGGPVGGLGGFDQFQVDEELRPPQLIYGLSRPSADMLLQEIRLRIASLEGFVRDGNIQIDRLARVPSLRPVSSSLGRLTSRFGRRIDPINHRLAQHNGIDIAANRGTPVYAAARGVVVASGYESQLGNVVRINHGNRIETLYAHMDSLLVPEGKTVERGEKIGTVGTTGRTTGPHLHFEVHVNGVPVDGRKYIGD